MAWRCSSHRRTPDRISPRRAYEALVANRDFQPTFRKRPAWLLGGIGNIAWAYDDDDDIDVDYHLRRSALPSPGRVRDLLELTSRLHSTLLDRHRPLWEAHFVEGLNDGRFAFYSKFHHSSDRRCLGAQADAPHAVDRP